jgi:thiamine biosynthesis lipoprotein
MAFLRLARHAMATRFEIVLCGDDLVSLRAAGEEALTEIERLENQLSLFRPASEIARLNSRAAHQPVRVTPAVFNLLLHAKKLTTETKGAFDITIAPLVRCWGFMGGSGHLPSPEELSEARARVGMDLVHLDADELSVRFKREGVMLDLGAIGKGYAIERAVELLSEAGVQNALIHGGTSTVHGMGHPPGATGWNIEIPDPRKVETLVSLTARAVTEMTPDPAMATHNAEGQTSFATVSLRDESLSVSAVWGKSFRAEGKDFGHILDPRTGRPASKAILSAVALPSATETDALSTALLTLGLEEHDELARLRPQIRTLVVALSNDGFEARAQGITFPSLS